MEWRKFCSSDLIIVDIFEHVSSAKIFKNVCERQLNLILPQEIIMDQFKKGKWNMCRWNI